MAGFGTLPVGVFAQWMCFLTRAKDFAPGDRSQLQMPVHRGGPKFLMVRDATPGRLYPPTIGQMLGEADDGGVLTAEQLVVTVHGGTFLH